MPLPEWMNSRKEQNRRSAAQEKSRAAQTGGRTRAGSGSSWRQRHDNLIAGKYLEQVKFTTRRSHSIELDKWEQYRKDCHDAGTEPRYVLDFCAPDGKILRRLIVTEEDV